MNHTVVSSKVVSSNERKPYVAPAVEIVSGTAPAVLYTATITQGGDDPGDLPIDAKRGDLHVEFRDLWDE
jgi:hypothetical protein